MDFVIKHKLKALLSLVAGYIAGEIMFVLTPQIVALRDDLLTQAAICAVFTYSVNTIYLRVIWINLLPRPKLQEILMHLACCFMAALLLGFVTSDVRNWVLVISAISVGGILRGIGEPES